MPKPLANVYTKDGKLVGNIQALRGKYAFTPTWDAGENIPARFAASSPEELRVQIAERGLRYENLSKEHTMNSSKLETMLLAEREMASVWGKLTDTEKKVYLTANPGSRFVKVEASVEEASLMEDDPHKYIRNKLVKHGWEKTGKNSYKHKNGKTLQIQKPSTHEHHIAITHRNGDVTEVHANHAGHIGYNIVKHSKSAPAKKLGALRLGGISRFPTTEDKKALKKGLVRKVVDKVRNFVKVPAKKSDTEKQMHQDERREAKHQGKPVGDKFGNPPKKAKKPLSMKAIPANKSSAKKKIDF